MLSAKFQSNAATHRAARFQDLLHRAGKVRLWLEAERTNAQAAPLSLLRMQSLLLRIERRLQHVAAPRGAAGMLAA